MCDAGKPASLPQLKEMAKSIRLQICAATYAAEGGEWSNTSDEAIDAAINYHLAPLYAESERLARYETELERAASLLQGLISIGQVKAIGLLEVAAGVERLGQEKREDIDRLTKLLGGSRHYVADWHSHSLSKAEHSPANSENERRWTNESREAENCLTRIDKEIGGK